MKQFSRAKIIIFFLCTLFPIISIVPSTLADSYQHEAIQQTEDQWKAVRQTLQQSKKKFDDFHKTYQKYKEAAFNIKAEKQIDFVRRVFKLNRNETQKIKNKLIAVRDIFDKLDRNGLQAKLEKTAKALEFADGVAGHVDDAWDFAKKFNPENAKDDPTYGLRLIGELLKDGAGKLKKVPIIGQMMGKLVTAYANAATDYANALTRLDKKLEEARGGSLCGQLGKKKNQQRAFAAVAQNNEDCQTYLSVKIFPRLRGEVFEGNNSYFLYSPQSKRGYFAPIGATTQVYQWHEQLLERRALNADWLASRARSLTAKVESRARQYYRNFSGWQKKSDPGWLLIEKLGLTQDTDFYGSLPEETFIANYILDKKHHETVETVIKKFNEYVLITGTVYEQKEGQETPCDGAWIECSIDGQTQSQKTDRHGGYSILLRGMVGASVQTRVTKDNYTSIERSGRIHRRSIVGENFTLVRTDSAAVTALPNQQNELNNLRALRDKISQLGSVVCNASKTARSKNDFIAENSSVIQEQLTTREKDLHAAFKILREIDSVDGNIQSSLDRIENLTTNIADASTQADGNQGQTCQASAAMQQSRTDIERDKYYDQAYAGYTEAKATFEKAKLDFRQIGTENAKIKEDQQSLLRAKQLTETKGVIPADLLTAGNKVNIARQELDVLFDNADESSTQLETVLNSAELLGGQIKRALKPKTGNGFLSTLKELGRKKSAEEVALKKIMKQISAQQQSAKKCLKKIGKNRQSARQETDKLNLQFTKLEKKLSRLQQAFLPGIDGQLKGPVKTAFEQYDSIELLTNMGKGYLDRCMEQLLQARLCMNDAEKLSSITFSMQLPNLRGQTCDQATAVLAGYHFMVISAGQATNPDWEYRVDGTEPGSGATISKADSSILISCYDDLNIPAYLATVDCSAYEGSTAVYIQDQHKAACDCRAGKIWGKSGQRCIDCARYEDGARNAFNAGNFNTAQQLAMEASGCPWSGSALSQIAAAQQQQTCGQIVANMQAACANKNAAAASGFWKQAINNKCKIDPQLVQWASNLIDQYNQRVALQQQENQRRRQAEAQRQAQQQQQNQANWMDAANALMSGIKTLQGGNNSSPANNIHPVPSSPSFEDMTKDNHWPTPETGMTGMTSPNVFQHSGTGSHTGRTSDPPPSQASPQDQGQTVERPICVEDAPRDNSVLWVFVVTHQNIMGISLIRIIGG